MKKSTIYITLLLALLAANPLFSRNFQETRNIIESILQDSDTPSSSESTETKPDTATEQQETFQQSSLPRDDEVLLETAHSLYRSGHPEQSLRTLEELIKNYPRSPMIDTARNMTGQIYIDRYQYGKAIEALSQIERDSGEYPLALYRSAVAYRLNGNSGKAIESYQRLATLAPTHERADDALLKQGNLYLAMKQGEEALDSVITLLQRYPDRETADDAWYLLGEIFEKDPVLKDPEMARRIYRTFIDRAGKGQKPFAASPLLPRVKQRLHHIEQYYFRREY